MSKVSIFENVTLERWDKAIIIGVIVVFLIFIILVFYAWVSDGEKVNHLATLLKALWGK